jgi:hypothetical protein
MTIGSNAPAAFDASAQGPQWDWWIATGPLAGDPDYIANRPSGRKVLGPFVTFDLAIEVRVMVERRDGTTYWITREPAHSEPSEGGEDRG